MKTSTEYTKNLKNKIITSDMLYDSIFSLNKRAKNNRDMKNQYSWIAGADITGAMQTR